MAELLEEFTSDPSTGVPKLLAGGCYLGSLSPTTEFLAESSTDPSTDFLLLYCWQAVATSFFFTPMTEFLAESTSDTSTDYLQFSYTAGRQLLPRSFTPMAEFLAESTSDTSTDFLFLRCWQAVATSILLLMAEFLAASNFVP